MGMKTAEQYLVDEFYGYEYYEMMDNLNCDITPSLVSAMKKYALQEVEKFRAIAANNVQCKFKLSMECTTIQQENGFKMVDSPYHIIVDSESITSIKIELT